MSSSCSSFRLWMSVYSVFPLKRLHSESDLPPSTRGLVWIQWREATTASALGKSAYITIVGWDDGKRGLHARLIMCLTVAAQLQARPAEQKVGRRQKSQRQADSLTDFAAAAGSPRPERRRGGGSKVTAGRSSSDERLSRPSGCWHVEWTHSVQPAHSSQDARLDPSPVQERCLTAFLSNSLRGSHEPSLHLAAHV